MMNSPSLYGQPKRATNTNLETPLIPQIEEGAKRSKASLGLILSKSMAKTFFRLKSLERRRSFVDAELANGIAHQVRILRQQRGWTQAELAKRLKTTQGTVSRIEDPSYGRVSVKTLLDLSSAFDIGLFVRFMPFTKLLEATKDLSPSSFEAESYEEESLKVCVHYSGSSSNYLSAKLDLKSKTGLTTTEPKLYPIQALNNFTSSTESFFRIVKSASVDIGTRHPSQDAMRNNLLQARN